MAKSNSKTKKQLTSLKQEEERFFLPDKFRVDLDTDESRALRAQAEQQQADWRQQFATPFLGTSPAIRQRARALIIIDEYKAIGLDKITDTQLDEYAEACAELGMFRAAFLAHSNPDAKQTYLDYNEALEREDAEWCEHGRRYATAEKDVWSYVHGRDVTIMRCTKCGFRNAKDVPDHVTAARSKREEIRKEFSGLKPLEAKAAMERDPRFASSR